MPILKLKGGLGNQMFQYATGLFIAQKHNQKLKLDITGYNSNAVHNSDTPREFELISFNISTPIASTQEILRAKYPLGIITKGYRFIFQKVFWHYNFDYIPSYLNKKRSYIEGYFQSEKNFKSIESRVRSEFTLKTESETFLKYKNVMSQGNTVSVHIRRSDYITDKNANKYHGLCSIEYYKNAMEYMFSKLNSPIFIFFSDDIDWVKENFDDSPTTFFVEDKNLKDHEELILMSYCKNNIIANSTFSWWGAWLNTSPQKIVIAPKRWRVTNTDKLHPNLLPPSWIKI